MSWRCDWALGNAVMPLFAKSEKYHHSSMRQFQIASHTLSQKDLGPPAGSGRSDLCRPTQSQNLMLDSASRVFSFKPASPATPVNVQGWCTDLAASHWALSPSFDAAI